jgi:hypothetical protein
MLKDLLLRFNEEPCTAAQLLTEVYGCFPKSRPVVLLPLPYADKGCKLRHWQEITYHNSLERSHLELLLEAAEGFIKGLKGLVNGGRPPYYGGIGVRLGPLSSNLVTIDIDLIHLVEPVVRLNPIIEGFFRTIGNPSKGGQFWLYAEGDYEPNVTYPLGKDGGIEFRGNSQSVLLAIHDLTGKPYQHKGFPQPRGFPVASLVWPNGTRVSKGPPTPPSARGVADKADETGPELTSANDGGTSEGGRKEDFSWAKEFPGCNFGTLDLVGLMTWLGKYLRPDPTEKHPDRHLVECPWIHEHTAGAKEADAAIFQHNTGQWPNFKCFHAHCAKRRLGDVLLLAESVEPGTVKEFCKQVESGVEMGSDAIQAIVTKTRGPRPMAEDAFYGVAAEIVKVIEPKCETNREALLVPVLVSAGNMLGRDLEFRQAGKHHSNDYTVVVGLSGIGKGAAWNNVESLFYAVDYEWITKSAEGGYQSGESVVTAIRDAKVPPKGGEPFGEVKDKRLLIVEEEFGRLLSVATRDKNTLSHILRNAWKSKPLSSRSKTDPEKCMEPHVSIIAHITPTELSSRLSMVEQENGFGNRILWVHAYKTKDVPRPEYVHWREHPEILRKLRDEKAAATHVAGPVESVGCLLGEPKIEMTWSDHAARVWDEFYKEKKEGVANAMLSRWRAHTLRLAMIYCALDSKREIVEAHLRAAIAVWDYCEETAILAFGEKTESHDADQIYWELQRHPQGMKRTEIYLEVFNNHITKTELNQAFDVLVRRNMAYSKCVAIKGSDRPVEMWYARRTLV